MAAVRGQEHAKRALEVACAGGHNILITGLPGADKPVLARLIPSILASLAAGALLGAIWKGCRTRSDN